MGSSFRSGKKSQSGSSSFEKPIEKEVEVKEVTTQGYGVNICHILKFENVYLGEGSYFKLEV